jgi:hypothetical protein
MTSFVLIANIAGGEHGREFATMIEARAYGKLLQKQPATISFEIKRAEPSGFTIEDKWKRHGGRMRGMNCLRFESKLREAEFFYSKLLEQEKVTIRDKTHSAFISVHSLQRQNQSAKSSCSSKVKTPTTRRFTKNGARRGMRS